MVAMRIKKILAGLMVFTVPLSACSCASGRRKGAERGQSPESSKPETEVSEPVSTDTDPSAPYGDPDPTPADPSAPIEFTMFTEMTGYEINISKDRPVLKQLVRSLHLANILITSMVQM